MFDDDFELPDDLAALADAASAALSSMGEEFAAGAQKDAGTMLDHLRRAQDADDDASFLDAITVVFGFAHDLKGQGGTFGYDLVTELGDHLCTLARPNNSPTRENLPRMQAIGQAIYDILAGRIEGDGGSLGARLRIDLGLSHLPC